MQPRSRSRHIPHTILICLALCGAQSVAAAAGDPVRGQALYKAKCSACHSLDYNGVGPAHRGVFERKAGSKADYSYSPALQASTVIWNDKTLDKWLSNPEKFIPGQKMGFMVPSAKDRADLIAYLKQESAAK